MIFCGNTFASAAHTLDAVALPVDEQTSIEIMNADYDRMYVGNNPTEYEDIPDQWDFNTIMDAKFDGDLSAGNTGYYVENTNAILIRRREVGEYDWITLHKRNIYDESDFSFVYTDKTVRSGVDYEYAIVPIFGGSEGTYSTEHIVADFEGIHILGVNDGYHAVMETSVVESRVRPVNVVQTMNRRYPYVIRSGIQNYAQGSAAALFVQYNSITKKWDFAGVRKYRMNLYDFLMNGEPKILKTDDGRMWLVQITGDGIEETIDGVRDKLISSFKWTEVADCENEEDLIANGFAGTED